MSDVYCRTCDDTGINDNNDDDQIANDINSPACLTRVTGKKNGRRNGDGKVRNILSIESELELPGITAKKSTTHNSQTNATVTVPSPHKINKSKVDKLSNTMRITDDCGGGGNNGLIEISIDNNRTSLINNNKKNADEYELADDAVRFNDDETDINNDAVARINVLNDDDKKHMIRVNGTEELPAEQQTSPESPSVRSPKYRYFDKTHLLNEIECIKEETKTCLIDINDRDKQTNCQTNPSMPNSKRSKDVSYNDQQQQQQNENIPMINEKLIKSKVPLERSTSVTCVKGKSNYINCTDDHPLMDAKTDNSHPKIDDFDYLNGNTAAAPILKHFKRLYSTLPRVKKSVLQQVMGTGKPSIKKLPPTRITPDGTTIYYWCDLSKQAIKGYYYYIIH